MNRHIYAYLILVVVFSFLLHQVTELPYVVTFIVFAPMVVVIATITIPPLRMLLKPLIVDKNYEKSNVLIVVAIVESIILLAMYFYSKFDMQMISENIGLLFLVFSIGFDLVVFIKDLNNKWIFIVLIVHISVLLFIIAFKGQTDLMYIINIGIYYLLIHTIFISSYGILRHFLRHRFPYISNWKG